MFGIICWQFPSLGVAEVEELEDAVGGDEDAAGVEIAMQDGLSAIVSLVKVLHDEWQQFKGEKKTNKNFWWPASHKKLQGNYTHLHTHTHVNSVKWT